MTTKLKKIYLLLVGTALLGFCGAFLVKWAGPPALVLYAPSSPAPPILFTAAALSALALPVLYRAWFAHRMRLKRFTAADAFFRFQRNLLCLALAAPFIALSAYWLQLPQFHQAGIFLMALYAVYYFYPSTRRLQQERRIFRVSK